MTRFSWTLENRRSLPTEVRSILVPVDFSAASTAAMHHAVEIARERGARIDVVHVWDVPPYTGASPVYGVEGATPSGASPTFAQYMHERATSELEAFLAQWLEPGAGDLGEGLEICGRVLNGEPGPVLARLLRDEAFDLCVIGEREKGVREVILGSVADAVLREAVCPLVTVRPKDEPPAEAVEQGAR